MLRMNRRARGLRMGLALVAASAGVLAGCAGGQKIAYSPHELRSAALAQVSTDRAGEIVVPFEPTPEMVARAREYTDGLTSQHGRASRLVHSITAEDRFNIQWVPVATAVARETAEAGHGNCLSMTSLFVGLARGIGLSAYYVDASDRVNDMHREEELIVDTGHIAAAVRTERGWSLVDFTGEISNYRTFRAIDDMEALAHFYNNRGYEQISVVVPDGGELPWNTALADFQLAAAVRPTFARGQNNLGVAYARIGDDASAEIAYRAAIAADATFAAPRHNLGNLYLRAERPDMAAHWYTLAIKRNTKNPYAHYHLGLALSQTGDTAGAVEAFERAIALKRDYAAPRNLLAQAYRRQGRMDEADRVTTETRRQH